MQRKVISRFIWMATLSMGTLLAQRAVAQEMPSEYSTVLKMLDKKGDFKDNVLKVNIPRSDLKVTVDGVATPTAFGFGGWVAMTKGQGGMQVLMGDLVLQESEVNPVMSALLDNGLEVTALHNHFFLETPRIFYMHVHGHGEAQELARKLKPALALIGTSSAPSAPPSSATPQFDTAKLAQIVGHQGDTNGSVYKITIGRDDLSIKEMGAPINSRMGLNTWAAFTGTEQNAAIAGDVAMLDSEVQPVLKALRKNGLSVVAIHNHMTGTSPAIYFLHYWGKGPAATLASGFRAALDQTGHKGAHSQNLPEHPVLFVCEHGSAKSVVAAAWFNKLAAEKNLPWRAITRGTNPDDAIPDNIRSSLANDGLNVSDWTPQGVRQSDVRDAEKVITLSCELPASATVAGVTPTSWTVPAVSDGYAESRTAIVSKVEELLNSLAASGGAKEDIKH